MKPDSLEVTIRGYTTFPLLFPIKSSYLMIVLSKLNKRFQILFRNNLSSKNDVTKRFE
jgi:hypothetical protein